MIELLASKEVVIPVLIVVGTFAFTTLMFGLYLAVMNLKRHEHNLTAVNKPFAYTLLWVGLVCDVIFNVVIGTIMFLELPRELLMTGRVVRHLHNGTYTWRDDVAHWFARHFLDGFTPEKGGHVGINTADKK